MMGKPPAESCFMDHDSCTRRSKQSMMDRPNGIRGSTKYTMYREKVTIKRENGSVRSKQATMQRQNGSIRSKQVTMQREKVTMQRENGSMRSKQVTMDKENGCRGSLHRDLTSCSHEGSWRIPLVVSHDRMTGQTPCRKLLHGDATPQNQDD